MSGQQPWSRSGDCSRRACLVPFAPLFTHPLPTQRGACCLTLSDLCSRCICAWLRKQDGPAQGPDHWVVWHTVRCCWLHHGSCGTRWAYRTPAGTCTRRSCSTCTCRPTTPTRRRWCTTARSSTSASIRCEAFSTTKPFSFSRLHPLTQFRKLSASELVRDREGLLYVAPPPPR